jgi:hypothetical protein
VRQRRSLDAIRRDDVLLDALGSGAVPDDDPLALALAGWRRDLDAEPVRPRRLAGLRHHVRRGLGSAAVASALGLATLGGVAAAATQAGPGSALWPITRVVAADRVQSLEAAGRARDLLRLADEAAAAERHDEAARYLAEAERDTSRVRLGDGERELRDRAADLRRRLGAPPAAPEPTASPSPSASPSGTPSASPSGTPSTAPPTGPSTSPSPAPSPSGWPSPRPSPTGQPSPSPSARPGGSPRPSPGSRAPSSGGEGLTSEGQALLRLLLPQR